MKKLASFLGLVLVALSLTACNTVKGVGQDIKATGQAIETTAERAKP